MHYLLFYEVGDDYVARRAEFREAHLGKAWAASDRGELVLGGALASPVDGAVLLFKGESALVAEKFARADPYVTSGLVKRWHVREWATVAGDESAAPIRPKAKAAGKGTSEKTAADRSADEVTILRMWRGRATREKANEYVEHVTGKVFPSLRAISGHRGEYLLRRSLGGAVEFVVLTLWESMDAVRRFAGMKPEKAVVEPEVQAVLKDFEEFVTHFEIVHRGEDQAGG